ncbi:hypothetical protein AXG93_815s1300 [Marchantia polymorpha subsp. ruderalis]|uniref:Uncharacterized protein n=1 Tax=Marchantia polymorpha subsp. ruderalis TaxID=1480154 RepID=A0A176W069_MARPO|nr:hypothetical protein AXG93_815s1300 [Marchantia polymorpha subsp. ruderalis]
MMAVAQSRAFATALRHSLLLNATVLPTNKLSRNELQSRVVTRTSHLLFAQPSHRNSLRSIQSSPPAAAHLIRYSILKPELITELLARSTDGVDLHIRISAAKAGMFIRIRKGYPFVRDPVPGSSHLMASWWVHRGTAISHGEVR